MFEKVKNFFKAIGTMFLNGLKNVWCQVADAFRESGWKKLLFIDLPLFTGLVFLTAVGPGWIFMLAELVMVALICFYFTSAINIKGQALKNLLQIFVGIVGLSVGVGLWVWAREIAIFLAAIQFPRLTLDAYEAYMDAYNAVKGDETVCA